MKIGGKYNWRHQPERLAYMGPRHYPGDPRTWHQFEKVDKPGVVWSEVLDSDLSSFEETVQPMDQALENIRIIGQVSRLGLPIEMTIELAELFGAKRLHPPLLKSEPRQKAPDEIARIQAAEAKRQRKQQRRAAAAIDAQGGA